MSKESVDTKTAEHAHSHHSGAGHSHSSSDEFLEHVNFLKQAEKAASDTLDSSKVQAAQIEAAGREKAVEISAKAQERAVLAKNETLAKGREQTDGEVGEIIGDAKKQAEKIRGKRLPEKDVASLSGSILQ
mgnify:CR=1 FL=1